MFHLSNNDLAKVEYTLREFESETECENVCFIKSLLAFKKKEYDKASYYIASSIRLKPTVEFLTKGHEIESYRGNTENLFTYLNLLVENDSRNGWHYYELAKSLDTESDFQRMFYLIETSISLLQEVEKPLILKYNILIEYSDFLRGTPFYRSDCQIFDDFGKIIKKYPFNNELRFYIAKFNYRKRHFDEAIKILEQQVESNKSLKLLGDCYFRKKDFKQAFEYYNKIGPTGNNSFFLNEKKGICSLKLNKKSQAKKYLLESFNQYNNLQSNINDEYELFISRNQFRKAKKLIAKKNKAKLCMSNICLIFHSFKTMPIQRDFLKLALNINDQNSDALLEMGLLHKDNCTQEALVYFLKSVQYDWENINAHKQLSLAYKELGQFQNYLLHEQIIKQSLKD